MGQLEFWNLTGVSDQLLTQNLKTFIGRGARIDAMIVAHLAEVEERRLHLKAAASSLFDYCVRLLGLSESEAFHRITAARLARRFPVIFGLLAARSIHLSALRILRDHLTPQNHRELLAAATNKPKREVEALVAALNPRPDVAPLIRRLPAMRREQRGRLTGPRAAAALTNSVVHVGANTPGGSEAMSSNVSNAGGGPAPADDFEPTAAGGASAPLLLTFAAGADERHREHTAVDVATRPRAHLGDLVSGGAGTPSVSCQQASAGSAATSSHSAAPGIGNPAGMRALEQLSPVRYLLRLSVSRELTDKLERARDLMSHANPSGELALVLERALDLLLEKLERQRFAQTKQPRIARRGPRETTSPQRTEVAKEGSEPRGESRPGDRAGGAPKTTLASSATSTADPNAVTPDERGVRNLSPARRTHREHIPSEIRRAVVARDGAQCTYVDNEGNRCPSRAFLQLHHEQAHARGGPSTLENLRLLCGSHNRLLAELEFGRAHQERILRTNSDSNPAMARHIPLRTS